MFEKSITKMIKHPIKESILIQIDSRGNSYTALRSNISYIDYAFSEIKTLVKANFQFTSIDVKSSYIFVGDEFGTIHSKGFDLSNSAEDLFIDFPEDCEIFYGTSSEHWSYMRWRNVAVNSLSFNEKHGLLVGYADGEVWLYGKEKAKYEITFNEDLTLCKISDKGDFIVCGDNYIYIKPKERNWIELTLPDYELPRVIFTDLAIDEFNSAILYVTSKNGFVLCVDLDRYQVSDMELPILKYFNIAFVENKLAFSCNTDGIQIIHKGTLQQYVDINSFRLVYANQTLFASVEEEHLTPQINAYKMKAGQLQQINSIRID